jgi:hypothetical protein
MVGVLISVFGVMFLLKKAEVSKNNVEKNLN